MSTSPNSCSIQATSLRGSRNHSSDGVTTGNGILRHSRPRSAVPQTMLSPSSAGAPDDVVAVAGRAPHDVAAAIGAAAVGAPHDVVAGRAPHDVVAVGGAPHD